MTVFRKIFKVKTIGNQKTGNLQPAWTDELSTIAPGVGMTVHEYNEAEGWCVCELWTSDHNIRSVIGKETDLDGLTTHPSVIEVLTSHPSSPPKLAILSLSGEGSLESVDLEKEELVFKGKTMKFKRVVKQKRTSGEEEDSYILDEG